MSENTTCYDNTGSVSSDVPCGFSSLSTCCGAGWDCLSNGLCREHGTTGYSQGSCTDPTFINCLAFCNQGQFDGFTEVSRCDANGNSWCCAGAAGQGLGGEDCCSTNQTTSLEPYPFSAIDRSGQSGAATSLVPSTSTVRFISSSSSPTSSSSSSPTSSSSSSPTSSSSSRTTSPSSSSTTSSSSSSPASSSVPTSTQSSITEPTSSASPEPASPNHDSKTGIEVGVPLAVVIITLLGCLAYFIFQKYRKRKQGLIQLQKDNTGDQLPHTNEMNELVGNPVGELDITHYEVTQPDAPRHELG